MLLGVERVSDLDEGISDWKWLLFCVLFRVEIDHGRNSQSDELVGNEEDLLL